MIRTLTALERSTAAFRRLLRLAVEVDTEALDRILRAELPGLAVIGEVQRGTVLGFAAFDANVDPVVIEYIAVAESVQGTGRGAALVHAVRAAVGGAAIHAETDDDAVGFYRGLGFAITTRDPDPRWPDRQRYDCRLAASASAAGRAPSSR